MHIPTSHSYKFYHTSKPSFKPSVSVGLNQSQRSGTVHLTTHLTFSTLKNKPLSIIHPPSIPNLPNPESPLLFHSIYSITPRCPRRRQFPRHLNCTLLPQLLQRAFSLPLHDPPLLKIRNPTTRTIALKPSPLRTTRLVRLCFISAQAVDYAVLVQAAEVGVSRLPAFRSLRPIWGYGCAVWSELWSWEGGCGSGEEAHFVVRGWRRCGGSWHCNSGSVILITRMRLHNHQ